MKTTYFTVDGALRRADTYIEEVEFYEIYTKQFDGSIASPENRIVPAGCNNARWFVNVAGLGEVFSGVDWTIIKNDNLIWILNKIDDMSYRDTPLATAVECINGEFISKWNKLDETGKNLAVLTSGVGVLLEYVIKDPVIRERTKQLLESENSSYPTFNPCSTLEGLDFSKYYFNLEIHLMDCWRYNCYESDCGCF